MSENKALPKEQQGTALSSISFMSAIFICKYIAGETGQRAPSTLCETLHDQIYSINTPKMNTIMYLVQDDLVILNFVYSN